MPVVQPDALTAFVAQTFVAAGAKQEHADLVATSLVNTNLTGHDSHGVVRVPQYLMLIQNGDLDPKADPAIEHETPVTARVDGHWTLGQVTANFGMRTAIAKAQEHGMATVALINCGHVGRLGEWTLMAADAGLIGLGFMDAGARSFYNKERPIEKPEDLQGLKVRVMQNPIFIDMMSAMGGNGIPIAFNELYTALQTGVVDGAENNPPSYLTQNHYEQAGYYSLTEHLIVPEIFVFSKKVWDGLDESQQTAIRECSKVATEKERELWQKMEQEAMAKLEEMGVKINEVDKAPFIEITAPVREKFGEKYAEILGKIEAVE